MLIDLLIAPAYAQSAPAAPFGSDLMAFLPMVAIFVVFYFLLIRPQQKKAKDQKNMLAALKKGDAVITSGGIHGRVTGLTDTVVTLEIAEKVRIKVQRNFIASITAKDTSE